MNSGGLFWDPRRRRSDADGCCTLREALACLGDLQKLTGEQNRIFYFFSSRYSLFARTLPLSPSLSCSPFEVAKAVVSCVALQCRPRSVSC